MQLVIKFSISHELCIKSNRGNSFYLQESWHILPRISSPVKARQKSDLYCAKELPGLH